ncbi:RNA polymerase sigma-70 factor, ECF subfamily [Pedobacter steynii]|uniref:RNA polymerase sigma-70 factor, ECF subfamily n=1 Tax=Pedobacter steynii TaxID=430522 RepID=A0A1H0AHT1_9SPHI|nr:sigma-70 family RNA polymerase sigma factor [Pedobacter steynii]NQX41357.1 sigma-70 family RNA polymerase sigma factor [Pedobacter steynii]SDN32975.1 RNA polymerase sigma-70 factor, ECF subfamily [Pedobacter steynii]
MLNITDINTEKASFEITEETFALVYKTHWKKLYYLCYHKLQDQDLSKDMVHDLFRSIWERRETLIISDSIEKYLVRSVKFKISTYFREKIQQERNLEESMRYCKDTDLVTEKHVAFNFLTKEIASLVDKLPERCKLVYRLSRENGMNNRQIASSLLLSEKTVENQLTKALSFIRQHLADYKNE